MGTGSSLRWGAGEFNKYGCDIFYRATNTKNKKTVLEAKTGIVFFNYEQNKISTVPERFRSQFSLGDQIL